MVYPGPGRAGTPKYRHAHAVRRVLLLPGPARRTIHVTRIRAGVGRTLRNGIGHQLNLVVAYDSADRPVFDAGANVPLPATRVVGRVTDAATGTLLTEAVAQIRGGDIQAKTGADGRYRLSPLQSGAPTLEVSARGYATARRASSVSLPGRSSARTSPY